MKRLLAFAIGLSAFGLPACGPLLDFQDAIGPQKYGRMTPSGELKRDFWGNTYIEPYRRPLGEPTRPESDPSNTRDAGSGRSVRYERRVRRPFLDLFPRPQRARDVAVLVAPEVGGGA